MQRKILTLLTFATMAMAINAQEATSTPTLKPLRYGNFESWAIRYVDESFVIGGATKKLYVIGPHEIISADDLGAYDYKANTPWTSSNAYAKVAGIVKASNSVIPEQREDGSLCCRMDTKLDGVKVLGVVSVSVLVSGSIFTGQTIEPIKGSDDPYKNLDFGIPFTKKPKALVLDYKCLISKNNYVEKWPGIGHSTIDGIQDKGEFWVYLQKRWEDKDGNIHALRIATAREELDHDVPEWQTDHRVEIHYGDITKTDYYKDYMTLNGPYRAMNSKGHIVPIQEDGWGTEEDTPTHIIIMLTAGNQGAFIGTPGNTLWVDNVRLEY